MISARALPPISVETWNLGYCWGAKMGLLTGPMADVVAGRANVEMRRVRRMLLGDAFGHE